jgi:hypothetical protein
VLLGLVLLVGGGVGGWMILDQQAAAKPEVQPAGAALVIEAGKIPNDTQEPDVAEGAEADRTEGTRYKESPNHRSARPSARSGPRSAPRHRAKASDGREIKLTKENDPLSGVK